MSEHNVLKRMLAAALENNHKYKAAFRALLRKYQNDIDVEFGDEANNFCTRCCPFASAPDKKDCPAVICEEYHDSDYDEFDIDEDKCAEEIFKFYVENSNE